MFVTKAEPALLASLLALRNDLVGGAAPFAYQDGRMPELLGSAYECGSCPELQHCLLLHRALESGNEHSCGVPELFHEQTAHLENAHITYFRGWHETVGLEEHAAERTGRELWEMRAADREVLGHAFADMQLVQIAEPEGGGHALLHTFRRITCLQV